jgi:hypothetical protein
VELQWDCYVVRFKRSRRHHESPSDDDPLSQTMWHALNLELVSTPRSHLHRHNYRAVLRILNSRHPMPLYSWNEQEKNILKCRGYPITPPTSNKQRLSKWQICAKHAPRPKAEKKNIQWYYRVRMLRSLLASGWCRSRRRMFYACDLQSRRVRKTARL